MAFEPINTQEEFDRAIQSRLERERRQVAQQFNDYDAIKEQLGKLTEEKENLIKASAEKDTKISDIQKLLDEANGTIAAHNLEDLKRKVASEVGLPAELVDRLNGNDEKTLTEDAENLKKLWGKPSTTTFAEYHEKDGNQKDEYKNLLAGLFKEE